MSDTRSPEHQGGRRYRERYVEGFVDGYSLQPYGIDPDTGEWGPIGDPVTLTFPTNAIKATYPTPGVGPVTSQYPDIPGPGVTGGASRGFTLAYRDPNGNYIPIMIPTDRIQ